MGEEGGGGGVRGEECGERVEGAGESGVILGEVGGEGWRQKMEEVLVGGGGGGGGGGDSGGVEAVSVGGKGERTELR